MRQYLQKHKYHLFVLVILIIIVGISWYIGFVPKKTRQISNFQFPISNKISNDQNQKIADQSNPVKSADADHGAGNTTQSQSQSQSQLQITNYKLQITTTSTVYDAMKNSQLDFKTKTFSGLGEFVEEIGGLKNDPQGGKYWIYFINGETAKLGISTQIVKPGDLIEWNYGNID